MFFPFSITTHFYIRLKISNILTFSHPNLQYFTSSSFLSFFLFDFHISTIKCLRSIFHFWIPFNVFSLILVDIRHTGFCFLFFLPHVVLQRWMLVPSKTWPAYTQNQVEYRAGSFYETIFSLPSHSGPLFYLVYVLVVNVGAFYKYCWFI